MTTLSVVIPTYRAADRLEGVGRRVGEVLARAGLDYELLFVDDGGEDGSLEVLRRLHAQDPRVRAVSLARNFGQQAALAAGLRHARGEAVAILHDDLQDPPELLPRLVEKWREGYDVVYGLRRSRKETPLRRLGAWLFYRCFSLASTCAVPLDAGDFGLLSRRAVDRINALPERARFLRGLRAWTGLPCAGVPYERARRVEGESGYSFGALVGFAEEGLISFSARPLRLAARLGVLAGLAALGGGAALLARGAPLGAAVLLLGGLQLILLCLAAAYLAVVFDEVKARPAFLVRELVGSAPSGGREARREAEAGTHG